MPENTINAYPTKELFISMLIRDLTLRDAIGDLIDNSVDGARVLRPDKNYEGLWIKIIANENEFIIEDNCGGITVDLARYYAFRFGRPKDMPPTPNSVGQFGIGMKRALFKLGNNYTLESTTQNTRFTVEINVEEWEEDTENWEFTFSDITDLPDVPEEDRGTKITVTSLKPDVIARFNLDNFITQLIKEIELEHLYSIASQLAISINDFDLEAHQLMLLDSDEYKIAKWNKTLPSGINIELLAGISEPNLHFGGWYIFCNNRLVLGPEQTIISGWGATNPAIIPKYHGQFNRFRGYVFFNAEDSNLLPWTTTKNNMDIDSPVFQAVRQQMIIMARPVIDFLNKVHGERQKIKDKDERPLEISLEKARTTPISKISTQRYSSKFEPPKSPPPRKKLPNYKRIMYYKPEDQVQLAMDSLNANTLKQVGEKTFEYYFERECDSDA